MEKELEQAVMLEYAKNLSEEAAKQCVYFLLSDKEGSNKKSVMLAATEFARMFGVLSEKEKIEVK